MKKLYNAPALNKELFETADVITVSPFQLNFNRLKITFNTNQPINATEEWNADHSEG